MYRYRFRRPAFSSRAYATHGASRCCRVALISICVPPTLLLTPARILDLPSRRHVATRPRQENNCHCMSLVAFLVVPRIESDSDLPETRMLALTSGYKNHSVRCSCKQARKLRRLGEKVSTLSYIWIYIYISGVLKLLYEAKSLRFVLKLPNGKRNYCVRSITPGYYQKRLTVARFYRYRDHPT